MKEIPVRGGLVALVDDGDFELASHYSWQPHLGRRSRTVYAVAFLKGANPPRNVRLHRLLLGAQPGIEVDHIDGNGLNCQRDNLRLATHAQNVQNSPKAHSQRGAPTSPYKGVSRHKQCARWEAYIGARKTRQYLGLFRSEEDAALAYNKAAKRLFGDFARLNDIPSMQEALHA